MEVDAALFLRDMEASLAIADGGFSNLPRRNRFLRSYSLPGLDYLDEEAKCYGRLFEFCQVTFCHSRQWGRRTLAKF